MAHRFFLTGPLPAEPGQPLPLAASDVHHAVRVLRVRPGEHVEVVDPGGGVFELEVVSAGDSGVLATALGPVASEGRCLPRVTLFQGVAKGDKMDAIVRQAVEVGAEEIVGVTTSRSVVRLDDARRTSRGERWRRIAKSAAEQAKRSAVPRVPDPLAFADTLELLAGYDRTVVLWEEHRGAGIAEALAGLRGTGRRAHRARGRPRGRTERRGGRGAGGSRRRRGIARADRPADRDRRRGGAGSRCRCTRGNGRFGVSCADPDDAAAAGRTASDGPAAPSLLPRGVAFRTLGCKVNRVESETMAAELLGRGARIVDEAEAGVVVVSTCTVTGEADAKARKAVRHALASPGEPVVVITGCAAALNPAALASLGDRVVVEPDKSRVAGRVAELLGLSAVALSAGARTGEGFRTRALLKVQDGCDAFCAYCIVPYARGVPRAVPLGELADEAKALVAAGAREIVLTGINIGRYSMAKPRSQTWSAPSLRVAWSAYGSQA